MARLKCFPGFLTKVPLSVPPPSQKKVQIGFDLGLILGWGWYGRGHLRSL